MSVDTNNGTSDYRARPPKALPSLTSLDLARSRGKGAEWDIVFMIDSLWPNVRTFRTSWSEEAVFWDGEIQQGEAISWDHIWTYSRTRQDARALAKKTCGGMSHNQKFLHPSDYIHRELSMPWHSPVKPAPNDCAYASAIVKRGSPVATSVFVSVRSWVHGSQKSRWPIFCPFSAPLRPHIHFFQ